MSVAENEEPEDIFADPVRDKFADEFGKMSAEERQRLIRLALPRVCEPYFRHIPHPAQQVFLSLRVKEAMYGGAAGGGKSDALLMAALQYCDVPGYSALILRRTWPDLNAPGAILDRARTWLNGTGAKQRDGGRIWEFPTANPASPARLQFGYLLHDKDKYKFQSAEYQFVGFDELTHFEAAQYHYMFSRVRRPKVSCLNCSTAIRRYKDQKGSHYWKHVTREGKRKCQSPYPDQMVLNQYTGAAKDGLSLFDVPLRVRSATNPGGVGHIWVKEHFIDERTRNKDSVFVPARLTDNPSLDQDEYRESLSHLLPVDRERLLNGDWDVEEEGALFQRHNFNVIHIVPASGEVLRFWDMAATLDGDYTVGALVRHVEGRWIIEDIARFRGKPHEVERFVYATALKDGAGVPIRMEQEPGSSGVMTIDHYRRNILRGFDYDGVRSTGDKVKRAYPFASAAQAGNVDILAEGWNRDFLDEAALFPNGANDDQIDAVSGAIHEISFGSRTRLIV